MAERPSQQKSDWSSLPPEILRLVLKKLSYISNLRVKAVCSSWRNVVKDHIESATYSPSCLYYEKFNAEFLPCLRFLDIQESSVFELYNVPKNILEGICLGSSRGWFLFLDNTLNLVLYHPFSRALSPLPCFDTFPDVMELRVMAGGDVESWCPESVRFLQRHFVAKLVLCASPFSCTKKNIGVLVMYTFSGYGYQREMKLAFCNLGDDNWKKIDGDRSDYEDIALRENGFFALHPGGEIEVWDFQDGFPVKTEKVGNFSNAMIHQIRERELYECKYYIAAGVSGDLMLIVRYFKTRDALFRPESMNRITTFFHVFKLDFGQEEDNCVPVTSLGKDAIFVGGNHTISVSAQGVLGCEENSIYFTPDRHITPDWLINLDGTSDLGLFNLADQKIKPCCDKDMSRGFLPLFWAVANPST